MICQYSCISVLLYHNPCVIKKSRQNERKRETCLKSTVYIYSGNLVSSFKLKQRNLKASISDIDIPKDTPAIYLYVLILKDNSLVLTGPKRGLAVCGSLFFEINLKVKDVHGREVKDERLSKGMLDINGITRQTSNFKYGVETGTLVSMHSTLEMNFAFVRDAVEGTVEIRILEGPVDFHGKIIATPTRVPCEIVLHDSRVNGLLTAGDDQVMRTARRVVCVSVGEMLLVTVAPEGGDELSPHTVRFASKLNGYAAENMMCGNYKMQVKVTWSIVM
uniref:DUF6598 domain-containing protein n=1 Tax=Aegilops tauschii subsp. strangulata TaxID=200361 RepID=A0A453STK8_AEGTS